MAFKFTFNDGSYYISPDSVNIPVGTNYESIVEHSLIASYSTLVENVTTPSFSKVDLDGHTWKWNASTGSFTITGGGVSYTKNLASSTLDHTAALWLTPHSGDNTTVGLHAETWDCWANVARAKWFRGYKGIALFEYGKWSTQNPKTLGDFIATIGINYYRAINFVNDTLYMNIYNDGTSTTEDYNISWWASASPQLDLSKFPNTVSEIVIPPSPNDPYNPGGNSGGGGGEGNFDNTTIPVDIPALPTLSAVDTGFISLYNPSLSQLNDLASYMWSDLFDLDTFKKNFRRPNECYFRIVNCTCCSAKRWSC